MGIVIGLVNMLMLMIVAVFRCFVAVFVMPMFMPMWFPGAAFPQRQHRHARRVQQRHDTDLVFDIVQRPNQKTLQIRPDPEHHLSLIDGAGLRGFQAVIVRRSTAGHQQQRFAHALHDAGHQRVYRLDAGHDLGLGGQGDQRQEQQSSQQFFQYARSHWIKLHRFTPDVML